MTHEATSHPDGSVLESYRRYLIVLAEMRICPRLRDRVDLSGVVQDTFLEAHRTLHRFRGSTRQEMAAWLRQILTNNIVDALRAVSRKKRAIARERSLDAALEESSAKLAAFLAADQSSPSQGVLREERALHVAEALGTLPKAQREALMLRHWHGWSLDEIARHMTRTPAAVAGLLKRGLRSLRSRLREETRA